MKRIYALPFFIFLSILCTNAVPVNAQNGKSWKTEWTTQKVFVENRGQFHLHQSSEKVLYAYSEDEMTVFFTATGVHYTFLKTWKKEKEQNENEQEKFKRFMSAEAYKAAEAEENRVEFSTDAVSYSWVNANPFVKVLAEEKVNDYYSYTVKDELGVYQNYNYVPAYKKIIYQNLYPGIDVEFTLHPANGIKYAVIVHPGADPSVLKMLYSEMPDLKSNGDLHFKTMLGDMIDHAPLTFYGDNKSANVSSKFVRDGKTISFYIGEYDKNRGLVIDPWVQSPTFGSTTWHTVWECEKDGVGNVYIIGGGVSQVAGSQMMVKKYSSTGVFQWTYVTPYDTSNVWLGTFATDNAGNSYVTAGSIAQILKIDNNANLIWNNPNPGGIFSSAEFWNIVFNCDQSKLIIGGTGGVLLNLQAYIYNVDVNSGNITSSVSVAQGPLSDVQEVRSISSCPNGRYYFMTHDSMGSINQNFTLCPNGSSTLVKIENGIGFGYKCEDYRFDNSGIMSVRADANFLYVNKGDQIQKRSLATLALISSATIPGGVLNTVFLGGKQVGNSGIDIDNCGNIYVGSQNQVVKFNSNLTQLATYPTTFNVYDVHVSAAGDIIACGSTGNSSTNNRTGSVQSWAAGACAPIALTCCDATICSPGIFCVGDAPINLTAATAGGTFSGPGITNASTGTFSPAVAGVGIWTIVYTLGCGSDSITIKVNNCAGIPVCAEANGDITANGSGPFTWYQQTTTNPCVPGPGFVCGIFTVAGPPVTVWTSFATTSTITPPGYPLYVVNAVGDSAYISSFASLPACVACAMTGSISSQTNISCFGGSNGAATVSQLGGSGTITYSWSPSGGSNATATGLVAGTYICTISDINGCTITQTVVITQPSAITASATSTPSGCSTSTGSATVTASGGSGTLTYNWLPSGGTNAVANNLSAGIYTVTVTDANGCTQTATATVGVVGGPTTSIQSTTNLLCFGNTNGAGTISATGSGPFTYSWSPSGGNAATATNLAAGTYSVSVTDVNGCVSIQTITITSPSQLVSTPTSTPAACGNPVGTADAVATGGTGPYTYLWNNAQTTATLSNLAGGSYSVTVTDANGCTTTATVVVGNTGAPIITVSSTTNILCFGGTTGAATVIASSGSPPYTYAWSPIGGNAATATNLTAGTYTITVTGSDGCIQTQTLTLTQPATAIQMTNANVPENCNDGDGVASASASGGTPGYTYLWSNSSTNDTITNLSAGSYSVIATDANGCNTSGTVVVTSSGTAVANAGTSVTITQGSSVQLNGTGGGTYSWSPATGLSCTTCQNPNASPSVTTTYILTVTDGNGCTDSDTVTVYVDIPCGEVYIPNAFSPNGDNQNDILFVRGACIQFMDFYIYNRWGEQVFYTNDPAIGWNGTWRNKECESAVFTYYIRGNLLDGTEINKQGNISLVK